MSEKQDQVKYADCMPFIRYRLEAVERILNGSTTTGYQIPDIETIALQFRKVFELIAMASLCANRKKSEEAKSRFDKLWSAKDILGFVERLNPDFYPVAIGRQMPKNGEPGIIWHLENGFLTKTELIKAHGQCGVILHADNPYRKRELDQQFWLSRFREWQQKTANLLRLHTIQLLERKTQWWIVMKFNTDQPVQVAKMKAIGQAKR